jgi:KDO2-lipid IV(A) lauroyltransferase
MAIFYYLFIKPVSLLPLSVLYVFSDLLFLVGYRILGYRKKVVWQNLKNSFPDRPDTELKKIMDGFYSHFCDLMIETLRLFSMPEEEIKRRCTVKNPAFLEEWYEKGRPLIMIAGHYNNWELFGTSLGLVMPFRPLGIYHPLKNKFMDGKFQSSRSRFGTYLLPKDETKAYFQQQDHQMDAIVFGSDQSPHNVRKGLLDLVSPSGNSGYVWRRKICCRTQLSGRILPFVQT